MLYSRDLCLKQRFLTYCTITDPLKHFLNTMDPFCLEFQKNHTAMVRCNFNRRIKSQNVCIPNIAFYTSTITSPL